MKLCRYPVVVFFVSSALACGGSSSSSNSGERIGTVVATVNGTAKTFPVEKDPAFRINGCTFVANASNPSDSFLSITGYLGNEEIYVFIATPTEGGSWGGDTLHKVDYATDYDVDSTKTSSHNAGGSASLSLSAFSSVLGTQAVGTFSGTLESADGSLATTVTQGSFSCTTGSLGGV